MRASGAPSGVTVARVIAFGSGSPAFTASPSQALKSCNGSEPACASVRPERMYSCRSSATFMDPGFYDYGEGISAVDARYERPRLNAVHVMIERGHAAVIDTGTAHCVPRVLAFLEQRGIAPQAVDYVVLTHVHLDHAGGAGALMARCPNAVLTVHPRGARHIADP